MEFTWLCLLVFDELQVHAYFQYCLCFVIVVFPGRTCVC